MDDNLLNQLKTAKTATFIIFETPEEGIGFPLSLKGLSDGYAKLLKSRPLARRPLALTHDRAYLCDTRCPRAVFSRSFHERTHP